MNGRPSVIHDLPWPATVRPPASLLPFGPVCGLVRVSTSIDLLSCQHDLGHAGPHRFESDDSVTDVLLPEGAMLHHAGGTDTPSHWCEPRMQADCIGCQRLIVFCSATVADVLAARDCRYRCSACSGEDADA